MSWVKKVYLMRFRIIKLISLAQLIFGGDQINYDKIIILRNLLCYNQYATRHLIKQKSKVVYRLKQQTLNIF